MPFFIPYYFGDAGGQAAAPRRAAIIPGLPIASRVIEVLQEDLPNARIYSDFSQSEPREDAISVSAVGGDWIMASTIRQRKTRTVRVDCRSSTADDAMRLQESVVICLRRSDVITIVDIADVTGGYDYETQAFYQTVDFSVRSNRG